VANVTIAVVDDHPVLLDGLAAILAGRTGFKLVGRGVRADDALALAERVRPDLLIIDLSLPGNPFEAIQKVREISSGTKVIVFTASTNVDHAVRALESGAWGYIVKGSSANELFEAIDSVLKGHTFITPSFAVQVINALRNAPSRETGSKCVKFSVREDQIVKLLYMGRTNKEIASKLNLSEKTVKHYMTLLMQKLHARNRVEVVMAAQKLGAMPSGTGPASPGGDFLN